VKHPVTGETIKHADLFVKAGFVLDKSSAGNLRFLSDDNPLKRCVRWTHPAFKRIDFWVASPDQVFTLPDLVAMVAKRVESAVKCSAFPKVEWREL
jgi:hypothetical protein